MMAKTPAERMREFRQRKQQEQGLKYTEVYIPKQSLDEANGMAASEMIPLREVLTRAVVHGLKGFKPTVTVEEAIALVVEELPKDLWDEVDAEASLTGERDAMRMFESLLRDGLRLRHQEREQPAKKRGRPAKVKEQP